ncbi:SAM-dependent methyltransferase [Gordonia sp. NPDC003585]|uniref:N5-glutamine methyltransferase family protein n=1 Tax=Gordonia sp. NPDC003585 TaxID=3154275 RepID=UPI0033A1F677
MTESARGPSDSDPLVRALRAAGSVFAEDEAELLRDDAVDSDQLASWCARRVAGEPLEQILGWVGFGDLRLSVGPGVFVPRQRSLLLAHAALAEVRERTRPTMLEPYCGVAPIATTVRRQADDAVVHATDVDAVALSYATRNLEDPAAVHCGTGLAGLPEALRGRIDVIAAVPPYVPDSAIDTLPHEARDHEPHGALLAGPDGLQHVRDLVRESVEWLTPTGVVLIEINHAQFDAVADHAATVGYRAAAIVGDDGQTVLARLHANTS